VVDIPISAPRPSWPPKWFLVFLLAFSFYLVLFFLRPINLFTADLGRHIINGRQILAALPQRSAVFDKNYYSYTEKNYPFINHHWFYGVFSYLIYQMGGFTALELTNALIKTMAIGLMLLGVGWLSRSKWRWQLTALAGWLVLPLVTYRLEIRPETISFFLVVIFYLALSLLQKLRLNWRSLLIILLPLQVFWVNTHIFWFFSFLLTTSFLLVNFMKRDWQKTRLLTFITISLVLVSLINPFNWKLILFPFEILQHYGYSIVENQTLWFIWQRFHQPVIGYTLLITVFVVLTSLFNWFFNRFHWSWTDWLIMFACLLASWKMNRFIPFFGLFLIPVLVNWLTPPVDFIQQKSHFFMSLANKLWLVSGLSLVTFGLLVILIISGLFLPPIMDLKLGLLPQNERLAHFIKNNQLPGPIFNNYDIGGYLIFSFFPHREVFVDNRPEAYPVDFLEKKYIRAQKSTKEWQKLLKQYRFQSIIFYRLDQTPWAQPFLISRIKDKAWVPIYVDSYTLVLVQNNQQNQRLIKKFRLPRKIFVINKLKGKV